MATPAYFQRPSMSQWNRTNPLAGWDSPNTYQGWRSPNEVAMLNAPLSDDQYSLLLNRQVADKSRQTRLAGDIQRAQDESAFLDSIQPMDTAGIFAAPTDARQARLQDLLNRDYKARELGSRLSMAGEREKTAMTWVTQKRKMELAALANSLANSRADNLRADQIFAQNTEDRAQNRELKSQQIEANKDYRKQQQGNFEKSFENQVTQQDRNFDFRTEQAGIRNQKASQAIMNNSVQQLMKANLPIAEFDRAIESMTPNLSEEDKFLATGYRAKREQTANVINSQASFYDNRLREMARQYTANGGGIGDAIAAITKEINSNPTARGNLVYDQNTRSIVPTGMFSTGNSYGGGGYGGGNGPSTGNSGGMLPQQVERQFRAPAQAEEAEGSFVLGEPQEDGYRYAYRVVNGQRQLTGRRERANQQGQGSLPVSGEDYGPPASLAPPEQYYGEPAIPTNVQYRQQPFRFTPGIDPNSSVSPSNQMFKNFLNRAFVQPSRNSDKFNPAIESWLQSRNAAAGYDNYGRSVPSPIEFHPTDMLNHLLYRGLVQPAMNSDKLNPTLAAWLQRQNAAAGY